VKEGKGRKDEKRGERRDGRKREGRRRKEKGQGGEERTAYVSFMKDSNSAEISGYFAMLSNFLSIW
jgi:hypothetical protein